MTEPTRRHPRFGIETEVLYEVEASEDTHRLQQSKGVCARNLSRSGFLLETEERLPPGTRLASILVRGKQGKIKVRGEVVWVEDTLVPGRFCHGIRITPLDPPLELAWKAFIDEESRELGRRRSVRFDVDIPVTCHRQDTEETLGGRAVAVNVSRGGFLVLLPICVPVGTILSLEARTPTQSLKTETRVVRLEDPRADGLIPHGLAFTDSQVGSHLLPEFFFLGLL